ncbi:polysaccharide deacetylase family protein [Streptomyces amakusaensis]|uniref:Polysaccharide deacetylase family protein n=1 Tax=Streptomyces amakusaensis TaxID=67271 RepID=A0ABW0AFH1_9ACTN
MILYFYFVIISVRRLTALALLGSVLVGCAADRPAPGPAAPSKAAAAGPPGAKPQQAVTPVFKRGALPKDADGDEFNEYSDESEFEGKTVALTFDADMTADQGRRALRGERFDNPTLVDALRELKVPSTVFMTGRWAEEYPDQARAIGADPLFEVANHSYSHYAFTSKCYGLPQVAKSRMLADVNRGFAAIRKSGARNVVPYFRFPGGCYDDGALRAIAPAGVTAVQWDVVGGDAFAGDPDAVAEQVLEEVKPGSVVVLHCTRSAAPVTEQALRTIVPALRDRGYRMVKVSELMKNRR